MNRKIRGLILFLSLVGVLSIPFLFQTETRVGAAAATPDPLLMYLSIGGAAVILILTAVLWKLKPVPAC